MTNHMHIVGVPRTGISLARTMALTNLPHTQYMNRLHKRTGGGEL